MKIITGRGQISSPKFSDHKPTKTNLRCFDHTTENFFNDLARVISSKVGVNFLTLPIFSDPVTLIYFPLGGGSGFESRFEGVKSVLSKNLKSIVIIIVDRSSEISSNSVGSLDPPYKRSADQSIVDSFKKLGLIDPSRVLFFSWERSPNEEQILALTSLLGNKVKTILNLIENTTIISTLKN